MKLGTSLRFLYPTGPQTYPMFKRALDSMPPSGFIVMVRHITGDHGLMLRSFELIGAG